jgi:ABC-type Zn uptake system ZnuABC Zn-binding protein ZnuA
MKNVLLLLSICFASVSLAQKPLVVATASIFADMAKQLGDTLIDVETIVPIGGDPHSYDPVPSDLILINQAQVVLKNGLTFEKWMDKLIDNSGSSAEVVLITKGITPITSQTYAGSPDPHAWMDAENGLIYAENIYQTLLKLLPEHEPELTDRFQVYQQSINDTHQTILSLIQEIPDSQRILITSHDAFQYFGQKYGLRLESVLGTSTEAEAQTRDVEALVQVLRANPVPAVFVESTVNPKMLQQIAADNQVIIGGSLYSDSIGDEDSEAPTYLDMLLHNSSTISNALSKTKVKESIDQPTSSESPLAKILVFIGAGFLIVIGLFVSKRFS